MSEDIEVIKVELQPFVKRSITTANGALGGTTVIDGGLTEPDDFWNGMAILIRTGTSAGLVRRVVNWDLATGTLTVNTPFPGQILNNVRYEMFFPTIQPVEDTGVNTNPERWMHIHHWEANLVTIAVAGAPGQQNLGVAVPAGMTRRIRTLHVKHSGTNNTVVSLLVGAVVKRGWDIPAQTTRVISSEDGWSFAAGEQPLVQTSDVTGGSTYVGAEGVEA